MLTALALIGRVIKHVPFWAWAIAIISFGFVWQTRELGKAKRAAHEADIAYLNAQAAHSKTERLFDGVTRQMQQLKQERDSIDTALKQERKVTAYLKAEIKEMLLEDTDEEQWVDTLGVRHASFDVYEAPFRVQAEVKLPPLPAPAFASFTITTDSLPIHIRIGCGPKINGAWPASVYVQVPKWANATVSEVSQSPDVCNPAVDVGTEQVGTRKVWRWLLLGGVLVGGYSLGRISM